MKKKSILVTGGAGFVGSFLVDRLIEMGHQVRILDSLEYQVHKGQIPVYLNRKAEFIKGSVESFETLKNATKDIQIVYHLASHVGVFQSNYEIRKYCKGNIQGAANLAQIMGRHNNQIQKVILICSMTGLGEGLYKCRKCGRVRPSLRETLPSVDTGWNPLCPNCNSKINPIATDETAQEYPNSMYAISKQAQRDILMLAGSLYRVPTVALRCFNIYGPRQSLSNPYTGVAAVFVSRLKNDKPIIIYEDGQQSRDFIYVTDVVNALILALKMKTADYQMVNLGSGTPTSISTLAYEIADLLGKKELVQINNEFRIRDIRHCFADISKAKKLLGWEPKIPLKQGLKKLVKWSKEIEAIDDFSKAEKALKKRGLQVRA